MSKLLRQTPPAAGFDDPVQQSQQAFRALLEAMSHPGRVVPMPVKPGHPAGLAPVLAAALLALCDLDTPVWIGPGFDAVLVSTWLRFHTGAPLVQEPAQAAIALLHADQLPPLHSFDWGSDAAPERGASLLIQVADFAGAPMLQGRGPGIRTAITVPNCGLGRDFWQQRAAMATAFPRGVDLYLGCDGELIGLPRSTLLGGQEN